MNNKMFWILIGFILIMQIPLFLMTHSKKGQEYM